MSEHFVNTRTSIIDLLNDCSWSTCLAFIADGSPNLNVLNCLQGTNESVADMIGAVNALESKLLL